METDTESCEKDDMNQRLYRIEEQLKMLANAMEKNSAPEELYMAWKPQENLIHYRAITKPSTDN